MKVINKSFIGLIIAIGLLTPGLASADTLTAVGQQIKITATVAPNLYVIVNSSGVVQQIVSNNYLLNLTPQVYQSSIVAGNEQPLTPTIAAEASKLLSGKTIKPGILYQRTTTNTTATPSYKTFPITLKPGQLPKF